MLKKNKQKVMENLKTYENMRDSDLELLSQMWAGEIVSYGHNPDKISAFDFLKNLADGKFSSPESIVRVRRKLQEQHPELRGKKWEQRHRAQEVVKEELRNF